MTHLSEPAAAAATGRALRTKPRVLKKRAGRAVGWPAPLAYLVTGTGSEVVTAGVVSGYSRSLVKAFLAATAFSAMVGGLVFFCSCEAGAAATGFFAAMVGFLYVRVID